MAKKKTLYLGIRHVIQMDRPSVKEIINNPQYEEELKAMIDKLKGKGDLMKAIKKVAANHIKKVKREYVHLTDNPNNKDLVGACIIIDIDNKKVIKNWFKDSDEEEMVRLYLQRYMDKIKEFDERFGTKHV